MITSNTNRQNSVLNDGLMPQESITPEAEILDECQKSIGYRFRQPELLAPP